MEIKKLIIVMLFVRRFKIDLIVWKSLIVDLKKPIWKKFKIDLIVWKCGISQKSVLVVTRFKIDLIVWK